MTREEFAASVQDLIISPDDSVTAMWIEAAEETAQYHTQYLKDNEGANDSFVHEMSKRLTPEETLDDIYAAFRCVYQKYGSEITQTIYLQGRTRNSLYPNSFMGAAKYLHNGGSPDQLGQMSVDELFHNGRCFWDVGE